MAKASSTPGADDDSVWRKKATVAFFLWIVIFCRLCFYKEYTNGNLHTSNFWDVVISLSEDQCV